ncbi:unnamed protein product [Camellia sinensis]
MAEQAIEKSSSEAETKKKKDDLTDPEFFSCVLQPSPADSDADYIGIRRRLLHRKAQSGVLRRKGDCTPGQSPIRDLRSGSQALSHGPSFSSKASNASDGDHPRRKAEPGYSFVGMHCIFDQCKAMVTVVKFGQMSSDLLAYGASDGTLTVCTVSDPPAVLNQLIGHSKDVTGWINWSLCIRVNNNFLSVGNANKEITVFNFSTGRVINKTVFDNEVTAMDHDHTGELIFCGDAQGCVYTVSMNSHTGVLSRSHRNQNGSERKSPVTTVQYRTFSLLARGPVVSLEIQGYLTLRCSLKLAPRLHSIQASFCPLLSLEKGEFIVVGSEDANVYFYYLTRPRHACVNKLQGLGYPIIGIAWNHGENLLASSDFGGTVIIWKRAKTGWERIIFGGKSLKSN